MRIRLRQFSLLSLLVLVTACALIAGWISHRRDYWMVGLDNDPILPMPTKYVKAEPSIGLLKMEETALDRVLHERCLAFAELSSVDRAKVKASVSKDLSNMLERFALKSNVFALRQNAPERLRAGLIALAMSRLSGDPRDISTTISRMHFVAAELEMDMGVFTETAAMTDGVVSDLMARAADRKPRFHETVVTTRYGIGIVDKGKGPYKPSYDLLTLGMDIGAILEADNYEAQGWKVASDEFVKSAARGTVEFRCKIDKSIATYQSFRVFVSEMESSDAVQRTCKSIEAAQNQRTVTLPIPSGKLICLIRTKSYLRGGETYESRDSLARFIKPIQRVLENAEPLAKSP